MAKPKKPTKGGSLADVPMPSKRTQAAPAPRISRLKIGFIAADMAMAEKAKAAKKKDTKR